MKIEISLDCATKLCAKLTSMSHQRALLEMRIHNVSVSFYIDDRVQDLVSRSISAMREQRDAMRKEMDATIDMVALILGALPDSYYLQVSDAGIYSTYFVQKM